MIDTDIVVAADMKLTCARDELVQKLAVVARAVERGATLKRPPQDQFYGDRDAFIVDPFGHGWTVGSHVEDVTPEELERRMARMWESA